MFGDRDPFRLVIFVVAGIGWSAVASGQFASNVVSYTSGTLTSPTLNNPSVALGSPRADTSFGMLTPFNAAFDAADIVEIGAGGSLVLQLSEPAPTVAGRTLGVHAAAGLIDTDWPNGNAGAAAALYTNPRMSSVSVSADNIAWHSLGVITFDMPTNYFSEGVTAPGYQKTPGTEVADFRKPFSASVTDFNGRLWPSTLELLDGSAGGSWLDLTGVPYANVNYIRFDVGDGQRMILDAVAVVPEPLTTGFALLAPLLIGRRRR